MTNQIQLSDLAPREFHVSRRARETYGMPDVLFSATGNVVFADFHAARMFAHRMNQGRDLVRFPENAVAASQIYALGLIDEVLHLLAARHRRDRAPDIWALALTHLDEELGAEAVDRLLSTFVDLFPPSAVIRGEANPAEYLAGRTEGFAHRQVALEELVLLWLANRNPAFAPFIELFEDQDLRKGTVYPQAMALMEEILDATPCDGAGTESLLATLCAPMRAAPNSLEGQLEFIRLTWAELIGPDLYRVLSGLDFLAEEKRAFFPPGPGPVEVPDYASIEEAGENYSPDREWMPKLVLLAKNAHVWLAQLSAKYDREITTLYGIPDEELALLADWGMTGLWLIGVWERSRASARIKTMMGDEDAVASAYSLADYRVADALGGEDAFDDLKQRAWRFGIRLSTDMVPNHMGIDSRWVIEHPDWFLSLDHSPFPAYSFEGADLSDDSRVGVFIEDHYWQRSDAAVVFKRLDRETGEERFIYHGNDGTSMPWNDTAQLDYLNPEVREGVIQTILAVARRSPVIRFDAAMTLARQHYQRLWFPEPGSGGDIPSRAEHGMTRAQFDALMPNEFWREVVDRVAAEAPDTLLLAEAFWLLEGYFVRTLGMHRVYNSAFMNMLRDERNAEYRQLIRSTLEFDPQILKRYVNFMSNPDERTAVDQFDTGDKYFGVATMLATLPGLPMFGHGQIEGLAEKYGMEFRRPRWEEAPNEGLVGRHEHQLFPLLRRRSVFAEVDNFLLFDLITEDGSVDENVFAYSNEVNGERSLVLYHNRYADTRGWIRSSTAVMQRGADGDRQQVHRTLAEGLRLPNDADAWLVYRDAVTGLEYIRSCAELHSDGFFAELGAYRLHVFLDLRELTEDERNTCQQLAVKLDGRGEPSIAQALGRMVMSPVLLPLQRLLVEGGRDEISSAWLARAIPESELQVVNPSDIESFLTAAAELVQSPVTPTELVGLISAELELALALPALADAWKDDPEGSRSRDREILVDALARSDRWVTLLAWVLTHQLGEIEGGEEARERARSWLQEWYLGPTIADFLSEQGLSPDEALRAVQAMDLVIACEAWSGLPDEPGALLDEFLGTLFGSPEGKAFLGVNSFEGVRWFNREAFFELLEWLMLTTTVEAVAADPAGSPDRLAGVFRTIDRLAVVAEASEYRVSDFLEAMRDGEESPTTGD